MRNASGGVFERLCHLPSRAFPPTRGGEKEKKRLGFRVVSQYIGYKKGERRAFFLV